MAISKRFGRILTVGLLALILVLLLLAGFNQAEPYKALAVGEPENGTVNGVRTYTFYPETALSVTSTTTSYSSSPRYDTSVSPQQDMTRVRMWNEADVFVTVDLGTATTITVTAQHSADGSDWADAFYSYKSDTLAQTTTILTSTGVTTATSTTSNSTSLEEQEYQMVFTADGTDYMRLPIAGEYLRFSMEYSGTVTPTIDVTLRNN